jgi:hypothetical protein
MLGGGGGGVANGKERSNFRQKKSSKEVNESIRNKTKIKSGRELKYYVGRK